MRNTAWESQLICRWLGCSTLTNLKAETEILLQYNNLKKGFQLKVMTSDVFDFLSQAGDLDQT